MSVDDNFVGFVNNAKYTILGVFCSLAVVVIGMNIGWFFTICIIIGCIIGIYKVLIKKNTKVDYQDNHDVIDAEVIKK